MSPLAKQRWERFLRDPSVWIILAGIAVRAVAAWQFSPEHGYDSRLHFAYVDYLRKGAIPRVEVVGMWSAHHPPLYYFFTLLAESTGLGRSGGQLVAVIAGVARLIVVDRLLRIWLPPFAVHVANAFHAFLPFAIRIDVFYSNESTTWALAVAAILAAARMRAAVSGVFVGAALLTKSSAVVTVPAVVIVFLLSAPSMVAAIRRVAIAGVISALLFLPWAWPNLAKQGTPYPIEVWQENSEAWNKPLFSRHEVDYYIPRFTSRAFESPYYGADPPESIPNALFFDAFGDYYNFLGKGPRHGRPIPEAANGRVLGRANYLIHSFLPKLGVVFAIFLLVGIVGFVLRLRRREAAPVEVALAVLGLGSVAVVVGLSVYLPFEELGGPKASYALGAAPIAAAWIGSAMHELARKLERGGPLAGRIARAACAMLLVALAAAAVAQRIVW